ncbi:MAG: hypothetical protein IT368_17560, partial [Candidatus Hydrogenedentes bacterium]|nr:hypothetical protein [Candidatus Hydrogenedentota bacterium]
QESGTAVIEGTPLSRLMESGHLDKYEGAKLDGSFDMDTDGGKKIERIWSEFARQQACG